MSERTEARRDAGLLFFSCFPRGNSGTRMLGMLMAALILAGLHAVSPQATVGAQVPTTAATPSTMEMTITAESPAASDGQIYVNEDCGIYPGLPIPLTLRK